MTRSDNLRPLSKRAEKAAKAIERKTRREEPGGPDTPESVHAPTPLKEVS
ncbi:hypothetical protein [Henriciella sp.]|nr:hypothetical protein [Henriciella sp.]